MMMPEPAGAYKGRRMTADHDRFKEIDSSLFKAFLFAAKELSFTRAAQKAAMTQSGVSQKIARLEDQVGRPLFLRINKTIALTDTGRVLLDYIERQQDELEKLFEELGRGGRSLSGLVRYGMPHSCLFTPHFPMLLDARAAGFPGVSLRVELYPNEDVVEMLLRREIDFGFVTRRSSNPAVDNELFAVEEYALVGRESGERPEKLSGESILELPFVDYPGMRNLFDIWRRGLFPGCRTLSVESLSIAGQINSLHGAVTMVTSGVGWSVMPTHVVAKEIEQGLVRVFPGTEKRKVKSEIHIVTLKGARQPARVAATLEAFREMRKV